MLVFSIIMLLLSTAVNNRRDCSILFSRVTILILANTVILLYNNINVDFLCDGLALYGGLITVKTYTLVFIIFILILSTFIISLSSFYPRKIANNYLLNSTSSQSLGGYKGEYLLQKLNTIITNKMSDQYRIIEYPLIILFCLTGAIFLIVSSDLITIFLAIELQSYGLYLISSIYRNSESSINAGLTYFLLGGLSSCIILLGMSLLYVNTGNTNLENIYIINNIWNAVAASNLVNEGIEGEIVGNIYERLYTEYTYMQLPFAIISVGLLFKIAAAPFHFWSPGVYDSIPTIVTTFVAIIAKISLLVLFLELIFYTDNNLDILSSKLESANIESEYSPRLNTGAWSNNLIVSAILSLIIGSVLGLVQHRIKKLYAYSTISHVGFLLLALSVNTLESSRAFFFYIIQYSTSNLNAFIILITIGYSLFLYTWSSEVNQGASANYIKYINQIKENKYSPVQYISQLKGYFYINPVLAISLAVTLFSFIGVPPLIGFFAKQMILSVALDNGYMFATLIAILTSVISAVYYLMLVKLIFFDKPIYTINTKFTKFLSSYTGKFSSNSPMLSLEHNTTIKGHSDSLINIKDISVSSYLSFSISLFTLFQVLFMFFDQELINIINIMSIYL